MQFRGGHNQSQLIWRYENTKAFGQHHMNLKHVEIKAEWKGKSQPKCQPIVLQNVSQLFCRMTFMEMIFMACRHMDALMEVQEQIILKLGWPFTPFFPALQIRSYAQIQIEVNWPEPPIREISMALSSQNAISCDFVLWDLVHAVSDPNEHHKRIKSLQACLSSCIEKSQLTDKASQCISGQELKSFCFL